MLLSPLLALIWIGVCQPPAGCSDELVVNGRPRAIDTSAVPDRVLAEMRGGILLDNGLNIAIGLDIQTRVDGLLLLHTVYASDGPTSGLRVYTDGTSGPRIAPGTLTVNVPGGNGGAAVSVDRSAAGTTISLDDPSESAQVNLVNAEPGQWLNANGQKLVPVSEGSPPVSEGPGTFNVAVQDRGTVVTLDTASLQIRHLIGQATGVVIANTANDRSIDTISSVNVELQGISPALLSGLFTADQLAFDAMSKR